RCGLHQRVVARADRRGRSRRGDAQLGEPLHPAVPRGRRSRPALDGLTVRRVGRPGGIRLRGRKQVRVIALVVMALARAGLALTLTPSTNVNTFVSSSSSDYQATQAMYRQFGTDPVVGLVRVSVDGLLSKA